MFNKIKIILLALVALLTMNASLAMDHHNHSMSHKSTDIVIHDPWVRSAPPNAPMLGVFMRIQNKTNNKVKLLSAQAKGYQRVELHRTIDHHGVMKMIKQDYMPIEANSELQLKPGSWHIMLIGPDAVPKNDSSVMINLKFDDGTTQIIHAVVRKGKMIMHHNHHKH